uniref:C-type lectin domain-containing protein n=1 Tax=Fundulus heteroclitus TaxID=8078 RepID=A0A3Q2P716_FUNHE
MLVTHEAVQNLKEENEVLQKHFLERSFFKGDTCMKNPSHWEAHEGKCYYINLMFLSWEESREECRCRGGDLVKIESREEQIIMHSEDKFWIGLTDSKKEGSWFWVDGSPLSFWFGNEPDDWTGKNRAGEDCVRMGNKGPAADLKFWFDQSCDVPHKSICEKAAGTGSSSSVCV